MGATTRYGFRWPANTAASTIWTWIQNLAEDVEGRVATIDDGTFHRNTATTGELITTDRIQCGAVSTGGVRLVATSSTDIPTITAATTTAIDFRNPVVDAWCTLKAGAFAVQSSLRFKEKVRDTRYGLADLLRLRPVDYRYREGHGDPDAPQTGLIAEEVAAVFPEAVTFDDEGQPDGIDYAKVVPVLIRAVQELAIQVQQGR